MDKSLSLLTKLLLLINLVNCGSSQECNLRVNSEGKVALRSNHGKYVVQEPSNNCYANRNELGPWEVITVVSAGENHHMVALRGAFGKYLSAQPDGTLHCDRDAIGDWEKFQVLRTFNGKDVFKSFHGKYLSAQPDGTLQVNRDAIGDWEEFCAVDARGVANSVYFGYDSYVMYFIAILGLLTLINIGHGLITHYFCCKNSKYEKVNEQQQML